MKQDHNIKCKPTGKRNPQANAVSERMHQATANLCRTLELEEHCLDKKDPWTGILMATAWAIRSTFHTALQLVPDPGGPLCDISMQGCSNGIFLPQII